MTTWKSVIVANDNLEHAGLFKFIFNETLPTVNYTLYNNAFEVIKKLVIGKIAVPDALIINADMTDLNGLDCLAMLRCIKRFDNLPIIMCSKFPTELTIETAYEMGATSFWVKSGSTEEIKLVLRELSTRDFHPKTETAKEAFVLGIKS